MGSKTLTVDLPEDFYEEFVKSVTEKGGRWRSRRKKETFTSALESAVHVALMLFLQGLDDQNELPEFREYAKLKYPELDEDMITMFEDLIKTRHDIGAGHKAQLYHVH
jgi:hypothetical protein